MGSYSSFTGTQRRYLFFFLYNVLGYRTSGASGFIFSVLVFLKLRWTLGSSRAVLRRFSSLSP